MAYRPRRVKSGDTITAVMWNDLQDELKRIGDVRVSGGLSMHNGPGGVALGVTFPTLVKVAKNGASAITAMSGSTPGSGTVTLYNMGATALAATSTTVTAYNMHPTETVTANAWVKIVEIDGKSFVFWEPCS